MNETCILTIGLMGHGKTYRRAAWFLPFEFLPNERHRVHLSNMPVNVDRIAAFCERKYRRKWWQFGKGAEPITASEVRARVHTLSPELVDKSTGSWMQDPGDKAEHANGPWDSFAVPGMLNVFIEAGAPGAPRQETMQNVHLAIDEAHQMMPRTGHVKNRKLMKDWIRLLRKEGWTFEIITQQPESLDPDIQKLAGMRYWVENVGRERDPVFGILNDDWTELKAAWLTSEWNPIIRQREQKRDPDSGRWVTNDKTTFAELRSELYKLYDSYSTVHSGRGENRSTKAASQRHWERMGKVELLAWFVRRNKWRLGTRFAFAGVVVWLCFLGGFKAMYTDVLNPYLLGAVTGATERDPAEGTADGSEAADTATGTTEIVDGPRLVELISEPRGEVGFVFDGERRTLSAEEVATLARNALAAEVRALELERALLRRTGQYPRPVAIVGDVVLFENGERLRPGDEFLAPEYLGQGVDRIHPENREVVLLDGSVVRLGGAVVSPGDEIVSAETIVDEAMLERGLIRPGTAQSGGNGGNGQ